jgi:hypothetical protein
LGCGALGQAVQLVGRLVELFVDGHFLTGGCSPVATRQIPDAARRAAIAAAAVTAL